MALGTTAVRGKAVLNGTRAPRFFGLCVVPLQPAPALVLFQFVSLMMETGAKIPDLPVGKLPKGAWRVKL